VMRGGGGGGGDGGDGSRESGDGGDGSRESGDEGDRENKNILFPIPDSLFPIPCSLFHKEPTTKTPFDTIKSNFMKDCPNVVLKPLINYCVRLS
ncbi:hypothetical protein, partial [Spirulina sp. CS-785/01]|uniref:hypothetical protein n=1 Tax=Spirulina sp. CS-785/01 TaxID=3021716 RepID=UPI00232E4280